MEQPLDMTRPTGTLLQQRYLVEDLLGRGGFGAVYLVRDQELTGRFAALKELRERDGNEKQRLLAECEILQRLDHPSLPRVQGAFEQDQRMYMLMEYIAGPNVEILRKQQPEQRFSFAEVVQIMRPIIEAVTYLHQQSPPLMHRDIKPANIIAPENGTRTILVDFGIAKEYQTDATTTAIRHCSPGYSAPEQYSSMGTDPRVDVYGLGATCYSLLTGAPPVDALQRLTRLASRGLDPLLPIDEQAFNVPYGAAAAIQRALAVNYEQRFATPDEFWCAFIGNDSIHSPYERSTPGELRAVLLPARKLRPAPDVALKARRRPAHKARLALVALLLLLSAASVLGFWAYTLHSNASLATRPAHPRPILTITARSTAGNYPRLATSYAGTLNNLLTHTTTTIKFITIQQSTQSITGTFIERQVHRQQPFSGVVDASKRLLFTITAQVGQSALFFEGTIRSDGNLVGNYCSVDSSGQCANGEYGLWSVSPSSS